jgi:hypothetical protein
MVPSVDREGIGANSNSRFVSPHTRRARALLVHGMAAL